MKVKVVKNHFGEGEYPTFEKGSIVTVGEECAHFLRWFACDIDGYKTYVPECFVFNGKLTRNYNPTELVQKEGDILEIQEIAYAWLIAKNQEGKIGWIPAENVISV